MKRLSIILLLLGFLVVTLPATTGAQEVLPLSSVLYADMDLLYLLSGLGTPSGSRPWTKAEAQMMLSYAEPFVKGNVQQALYDSLYQMVHEQLRWNYSDGFSFSAILDLSIEGYAHTNNAYDSYTDWVYTFEDRKPLAKVRLDMAISDSFYTYCDLQYGYGLFTYNDHLAQNPAPVGALIPNANSVIVVDQYSTLAQYQNYFANNIILKSRDFDFQWPKRAIFSVGGENWNVNFSRDRIAWGNSKIGNFILDDHVDFHEYLRFSTFSKYFKYEAMTVFFDTSYADEEYFRMLIAHRLEFRPWQKLTIAVSEDVMYKDSVFDIRFLNPAFILHNLNERGKFNAIAHLEFAYVPKPGLRVYGQFALDQATAPNEDPEAEDTAWALSLGLDYAKAVKDGVLSTSFEGSMALPSMYRRDKVDFLMARRYAGLEPYDDVSYWNAQKFDYIGSPYGGDAVVGLWELRYRVPEKSEMFFSVTAVLKGTVDIYTPIGVSGYTDYGTTMFKDDEITCMLTPTLGGNMKLFQNTSFIEGIIVYSQISLIAIGEYLQSSKDLTWKSLDVQIVAGTTISF
ncbi:MAG: hypothetical protein ACQ5SW_08880 [Sphaerochaetaceae bacterium]